MNHNVIGTTTGTYTRVKGISVVTGRGLSARSSTGDLALPPLEPLEP